MHELARAIDEALESLPIRIEIGDRTARHGALHRGARDGGRDLQDQTRIERFWDDVVGTKDRGGAAVSGRDHLARLHTRELRDGFYRGDLHRLVDRGRIHVQRATEDEREAEDVVDLVRIVRAPGGDDRVGASGAHLVGQDFGIGVG